MLHIYTQGKKILELFLTKCELNMSNYDVKGLIPWLYYKNLEKAIDFYENIMGFTLEVDQGWSKIYKIRDGAYIGLVDGEKGYHRPSDTKPVIICLNVYDADAWYDKLTSKGIKIEEKPKESERLKIKVFMLKDPEGYVLEIQESLPDAMSI
jgi:predicted enzyme related to lactoylglutathione lyase